MEEKVEEVVQHPMKVFIKTRVLPMSVITSRVLIIAKYPLAAFGTITLGFTAPYTLVILGIAVSSIILTFIVR